MSRNSIFIVATVITTVLLKSLPAFALGCPYNPDHWFNTVVNLDSAPLPPGITAHSVTGYYGNTEIYITNSTPIPLVINPPPFLTDVREIPLPDPEKTYKGAYPRPLILKFVSNQGYYCDGNNPLRCDMNIEVNKENAAIRTLEINAAINSGWLMKDDRPQDVKVPPPAAFEFSALYGNQRIPFRGTISFSLNNKYNPKLEEETKKACGY